MRVTATHHSDRLTNARQLLAAPLARGMALSAPDARAQFRGPDFGNQPRINALMVAGGCCHEYPAQTEIFMEMLQGSLPID